jgi:hypothetical protein
MLIVIPMAGQSSRFLHEGFTLPKYMLYAGNRSLFNLSVSSFSNYFKSCSFLFIARNSYNTDLFIQEEVKLLGIEKYQTVILDKPTRGQAETVLIGLEKAIINSEEPITIFNIDTFRFGFQFPSKIYEWDGFLEVFYGHGLNWSYAKTENDISTKVIETTEKIPISNFCSTGLYYFRTAKIFKESCLFNNSTNSNETKPELYIAPLYNYLIQKGLNIHIHLIDRELVQFCGIPEEYYFYQKQFITLK